MVGWHIIIMYVPLSQSENDNDVLYRSSFFARRYTQYGTSLFVANDNTRIVRERAKQSLFGSILGTCFEKGLVYLYLVNYYHK